jgi:hypothetical protein
MGWTTEESGLDFLQGQENSVQTSSGANPVAYTRDTRQGKGRVWDVQRHFEGARCLHFQGGIFKEPVSVSKGNPKLYFL